MRGARQTPESIRADFDRIASLAGEGWDHNSHYHEYLLRHAPGRCGRTLEVGCGAGEFSRLLAARAERVLAVDLSPRMVALARERSRGCANVDFVNADVTEYPLPAEHFDFVATLTTLHHLPLEAALRKMASALRPGGVFVCLDLYERAGLRDLLSGCAAYPAGLLLRLLKTGRPLPPREVREAYAEHGRTDTYPTLARVRQVCADVLPGAHVRRHLLWRYSVVWRKA